MCMLRLMSDTASTHIYSRVCVMLNAIISIYIYIYILYKGVRLDSFISYE